MVDSFARTEDLRIDSLSGFIMTIWTVVTCEVKNQSGVSPGEGLGWRNTKSEGAVADQQKFVDLQPELWWEIEELLHVGLRLLRVVAGLLLLFGHAQVVAGRYSLVELPDREWEAERCRRWEHAIDVFLVFSEARGESAVVKKHGGMKRGWLESSEKSEGVS